MPRQSKLEDLQWSELANLIMAGGTLKDAQKHCLDVFGVQMAVQSIGANKGCREAIQKRRLLARIQAGEALQDALPGISKMIIKRMKLLAKEADSLGEITKDPTHPQYKVCIARIQAIDSALVGYLKPYRDTLDWVQSDTEKASDDPKKSNLEYMKELDALLAKKDSNLSTN